MANYFSLDSIFTVLKYVLIVSNVMIIIGSLFIAISGKDFNEPELKNNHGVLIFACIMIVIFCLVGIVGAWKKHFALTISYAVLMTLALILEVAELSSEDIGSFLISIFIVSCAFAYAALIKKVEQLEAVRRAFSHEQGKI